MGTSLKVLFCGDTILKNGSSTIKENPFKYVFPIFTEHDYVIINLETVISDRSLTLTKKTIVFKSNSENLDWLCDVRDKVVFSLANNHIFDFGNEGYHDTVKALLEKKSKFIPVNKSLLLDTNIGIRLYSMYPELSGRFQHDLAAGNVKFDDSLINIVMIHWGEEHILLPCPQQKKRATTLIRYGADLIVGTHPHVSQPLLKLNNIPVAFSLGNFNMTQYDVKPTFLNHLGYMLSAEIKSTEICNLKRIWYVINSNLQPVVLPEKVADSIENVFESISSEALKIGRLGYLRHSSYHFLKSNLLGGIAKRLQLYGIRHIPAVLRWLLHPRVLYRVPFALFRDETLFKRTRQIESLITPYI